MYVCMYVTIGNRLGYLHHGELFLPDSNEFLSLWKVLHVALGDEGHLHKGNRSGAMYVWRAVDQNDGDQEEVEHQGIQHLA